MITVCFHGAESTGKSTLAARLHERFGWTVVSEYGREWAESHGTQFTMEALLAIAEGQDETRLWAAAARPEVLLLDTDPLMTAAWAQMLFDRIPDRLLAYPKADLYLLFEPDTAWIDDGTRFFGTPELRASFAEVCERLLVRAGAPYVRIAGDWEQREAAAIAAIARLQRAQ